MTPLVTDTKEIAKRIRTRSNEYYQISIKKGSEAPYLEEGWQVKKELKTKTHLVKPKPIGERLEDRFWIILAKMGYPVLSDGTNFRVTIKRKGADPVEKQLDILAKDDETVIVAECKASSKPVRRSLQKDVEELSSLKGPIANAAKKFFGTKALKIIWLFVTDNVIWSKPDRARAEGSNIRIITERELRYFHEIAVHLGPAARFQFLAEFLKGQKIPGLAGRKIPAIRGNLGGQHFFAFVSTPAELLKISFVNHRSLRDPEGAPTYQRLVKKPRLNAIRRFLESGGFFPNNLLLNFIKTPRFDRVSGDDQSRVVFGELYLPDSYQSAWVIDGQHRLYGFSGLDEKKLRSNLIVVAFSELSKDEEADLFVTINHEQKSVPRSLLDELEGELKWGSDKPNEKIGAITSRLVQSLKDDLGEPFYQRITDSDLAADQDSPLTITQFKIGLKSAGLIGSAVKIDRKTVYSPGVLSGSDDYATLERARHVLNEYFSLIKEANIERWDQGKEGLLCSNIGIQGFLLLFKSVVEFHERKHGVNLREFETNDLVEELTRYLEPVAKFVGTASDHQIQSKLKTRYGSGGKNDYHFQLVRLIRNEFPDLQPEGYEDWEETQSKENIERADRQVKEIVELVHTFVFETLKRVHGTERDAYWEEGVQNREIKTKAYQKAQDYPYEERLALENYLDFLDLRKIVEAKKNWPLFKEALNIPEPDGEKGLAKNLRWMDRINKIRRIPGHPTKDRAYRVEDFRYLDWLHPIITNGIQVQ